MTTTTMTLAVAAVVGGVLALSFAVCVRYRRHVDQLRRRWFGKPSDAPVGEAEKGGGELGGAEPDIFRDALFSPPKPPVGQWEVPSPQAAENISPELKRARAQLASAQDQLNAAREKLTWPAVGLPQYQPPRPAGGGWGDQVAGARQPGASPTERADPWQLARDSIFGGGNGAWPELVAGGPSDPRQPPR